MADMAQEAGQALLAKFDDMELNDDERSFLADRLLTPEPATDSKEAYRTFSAWFEAVHEAENGYVSTGDPTFYNQMLYAKAWAWRAYQAAQRSATNQE